MSNPVQPGILIRNANPSAAMFPTVFSLHTNFSLVEPLRPLFAELLPEARIINLVDDSLLADVRTAGCVTPAVVRRMMAYCLSSPLRRTMSQVGRGAGDDWHRTP